MSSSQPKIHAYGAKPPGKLEVSKGMPVWIGEAKWVTEHGSARCSWTVGKIDAVFDVLLPDGSRTSNVRRGIPGTGLWRVEEEDGVWTYGSLHLEKEDIRFSPETQPQPQKWSTGSLPYQLCGSSNACELVMDPSMADEVYAALCSGLWKMVGSGKEYVGSWRRAAEVVAAMRGLNEPYTEFFHTGSEGYVMDAARDLLEGMGWSFEGPLEDDEASNLKALKILEICEQKPIGDLPDWAAEWWTAFYPEDDNPRARMINAVFMGQASPTDLDNFWQFHRFD
jgi:hypothetical protein